MKRIALLPIALSLLLLASCSDDTVQPDSRADSGTDVLQGDGQADRGGDFDPTAENIGEPCEDDSDCLPASPTCVLGICSVSCIADDPGTEGNEDSCPDQETQVCSTVTIEGTDMDYCLLQCTPSDTANPCPAGSGTACTPGSTLYSGYLDIAVCWDVPCEVDEDCPVLLAGECTEDSECDTNEGEFCDPVNLLCALPGSCNTASGLCGAHTHGNDSATIGTPCAVDTECAGDQFCDREIADGGDVWIRNGYCTKAGCAFADVLPSAACPSDHAGCNGAYFGGLCQLKCSLDDPNGCRDNAASDLLGDYECYDWSGYDPDYASEPLCDYAPFTPCDFFAGEDTCALLGDSTNSTHMQCRDPATDGTLDDHDPNGYCLDDTASGPLP